MSYAVIHMQKIKGNGVTGMQIHNQREKESDTNTDIKKEQSHLNYDLVNDKEIDYHEKVKSMIDERVDQSQRKVRKDAVKLASFLITSDKDFFDRIGEKEERRFFETAHEFIGERYGKENIAYAMVHKDEKTPHMHLGLVPITEDNRLSAKDFFGKKQQLHELQDDFHSHMKEKGFDLERGVSSDKKHLETAKFKLQTTQEQIKDLKSELKEKQNEKREIETELKDLANKSKKIDQIEVKEVFIGSNSVKLARSDFESIKNLAKGSEVLRDENWTLSRQNAQTEKKNYLLERDNHELKRENKELKQENKVLKQENQVLKQELKFLHRTIEKVKVMFKDQVQEIGKKIGYMKADLLDRMGMSPLKSRFSDENEVEGGVQFLTEKEREKEKQNEKDEFELE